jgi:predicted amidophosphoribosyltransferase
MSTVCPACEAEVEELVRGKVCPDCWAESGGTAGIFA